METRTTCFAETPAMRTSSYKLETKCRNREVCCQSWNFLWCRENLTEADAVIDGRRVRGEKFLFRSRQSYSSAAALDKHW